MSQPLAQIPVSPAPPSNHDVQLVNQLFTDGAAPSAIATTAKGPLIAAILVGVFQLPVVEDLITKFVPSTKNNKYLLIIAKMVFAALLFYISSNWVLSRK